MGVSLTLVLIISIASTVVRVAGVMLELTGVPRHVARFQALSAISGVGFTTAEAEQMLHSAERRRILTFLIALGSLGLASIAATVIVGAFNISPAPRGLFIQGVALLLGIYIIKLIVCSDRLDAMICAVAYRQLKKKQLGVDSFRTLYSFSTTHCLAEHSVQTSGENRPNAQHLKKANLTLLGVSKKGEHGLSPQVDFDDLTQGNRLILWGEHNKHKDFANMHGLALRTSEH